MRFTTISTLGTHGTGAEGALAHHGNILIVGEAEELDDLAATLESFDYAVCATESSGPAALVTATKTSPELALVDIAVPGALDAARTLSIDLHVSVVYLTESPDEELLPLAQAADPLGYVLKPFDAGQLRLTLHAALATRRRLAKPRSLTRFPRSRLLETIFQSVNEGVSVLDTLAEVRYANPAGGAHVRHGVPRDSRPPAGKLPLLRDRQDNADRASGIAGSAGYSARRVFRQLRVVHRAAEQF